MVQHKIHEDQQLLENNLAEKLFLGKSCFPLDFPGILGKPIHSCSGDHQPSGLHQAELLAHLPAGGGDDPSLG